MSQLCAGLRWGRRGTLAERSSWWPWKEQEGLSLLSFIPAENCGPERQGEGERKGRVNPLSSPTPCSSAA